MAKPGHDRESGTGFAEVASDSGQQKGPAFLPGLCTFSIALPLRRLFLDDGFFFRLGLRAATRALGKRSFDFLDRFGFGDPLHG